MPKSKTKQTDSGYRMQYSVHSSVSIPIQGIWWDAIIVTMGLWQWTTGLLFLQASARAESWIMMDSICYMFHYFLFNATLTNINNSSWEAYETSQLSLFPRIRIILHVNSMNCEGNMKCIQNQEKWSISGRLWNILVYIYTWEFETVTCKLNTAWRRNEI